MATSNPIIPDQLFLRQQGFFNPVDHPEAQATFVGVGGIGSFAAYATAKLGVPNLTLIDPDTVEIHNAPNQMHSVQNLGDSKVEALAVEIASAMGETANVTTVAEKLDAVDSYSGIVVGGLDSMTAREELWERVKYNPAVDFLIDGRIAGQLILIYSLCPYEPEQVEHYEKTLHSDADAVEASCTERGLIDVGFQCGSLIARNIRMRLNRQEVDPITYMSMKTLDLQHGDWVL